ncbi:hypothetical protein LI192_06245 [Enterococcus avium]|nr:MULTISPECIES: hypothetical protein [Enterococcus]MCB6528930.1 hypothetical protein [Enterococcus avium]MCG4866722.1 hypothetical protein [Enterococcus avium]MCQ4674750.1 hypothetical protein [Enterococcus avium]MDO7800511.1 hypothetical protein [Enterococcus avium]OJG88652.1 hypothetical protein RV13_GL002062 [Enterococcus raffinosus]
MLILKKPTLAELIESAEKNVKPDDWYRQGLILEMFHGMSKTTLVEYCKEMEGIDEFKDGILRPGHSTTFIHVHTFIWFLRWKDENKYRTKKVSPNDILKEAS